MLRHTTAGLALLLAYALTLDMFEGAELSKSVYSWQLWIGGFLAATAVAAIIEAVVGSFLARTTCVADVPAADVRITIASCIAGGLAAVSLILARIIT
jgi:hypothetical protein